eukprot:1254532-Amphidinium_carterae.1
MVAEHLSSVSPTWSIIDNIKMWVYSSEDINMLQAHNTKLPLLTGFDGTSSSPPFLEWTDEIRTYINLYSIDIQYEMDQAIRLNDVIQAQDIIRKQNRTDQDRLDLLSAFPDPNQQDTEEMDQLQDSINTRPKRLNDASNFLNYILLHTTKGEPNLLVRRLIRTSSGLETWRQLYIKYAGGHRHGQIQLLQRILHPQWSESPSAFIS